MLLLLTVLKYPNFLILGRKIANVTTATQFQLYNNLNAGSEF